MGDRKEGVNWMTRDSGSLKKERISPRQKNSRDSGRRWSRTQWTQIDSRADPLRRILCMYSVPSIYPQARSMYLVSNITSMQCGLALRKGLKDTSIREPRIGQHKYSYTCSKKLLLDTATISPREQVPATLQRRPPEPVIEGQVARGPIRGLRMR